ncbi:MAG: hypothetical protein DI535_05920 [Citrobacter freundii]|nr:MAG: hypothetical protein DI535_05920 [Citrobacter freundii]
MKISTALALAFCILIANTELFAQVPPCYKQSKPLSYYAFQKMMRQHYNFTILGTQTPVSGFKVETSKPTLTLKGNIYSSGKSNNVKKKALIINLELTGGVTNDIQQILSGQQLNGYFKASLGFNVLFDKGNDASYILDNDFEKMMIRKKVCAYWEDVQIRMDTLLVLTGLEHILNAPIKTLDATLDHIVILAGQDEYSLKNYSRPAAWYRPFPYANIKSYYKTLLIDMIKKYGANATMAENAMFADFIAKLGSQTDNNLKSGKLVADFKRCADLKNEKNYKYGLIDDFEIESYKSVWTSKVITWLNVSATGLNSSFKLYDASLNTLLDSNSFLPGVNASYNYFKKYTSANKYIYFRVGLGVKRVNSLTDLAKFDYKKETVINVTPAETLKTEKSGTAYQGALEHGFGLEIPVEFYWAPWAHEAIPGLYGKVQYSYGEPWINKNKVSLDLGMIWNVNNTEKDSKNVLTIVPYLSWSNLVKEYKDEGKTKQKKVSELFSIGLKFGIPVNLGK